MPPTSMTFDAPERGLDPALAPRAEGRLDRRERVDIEGLGHDPVSSRIALEHAIGGAQERRQAQVDEIDIRQREDDVGVQHDAFVEQAVDDVEERRLRLDEVPDRAVEGGRERRARADAAARIAAARRRGTCGGWRPRRRSSDVGGAASYHALRSPGRSCTPATGPVNVSSAPAFRHAAACVGHRRAKAASWPASARETPHRRAADWSLRPEVVAALRLWRSSRAPDTPLPPRRPRARHRPDFVAQPLLGREERCAGLTDWCDLAS